MNARSDITVDAKLGLRLTLGFQDLFASGAELPRTRVRGLCKQNHDPYTDGGWMDGWVNRCKGNHE